jgi:hypothetical protein
MLIRPMIDGGSVKAKASAAPVAKPVVLEAPRSVSHTATTKFTPAKPSRSTGHPIGDFFGGLVRDAEHVVEVVEKRVDHTVKSIVPTTGRVVDSGLHAGAATMDQLFHGGGHQAAKVLDAAEHAVDRVVKSAVHDLRAGTLAGKLDTQMSRTLPPWMKSLQDMKGGPIDSIREVQSMVRGKESVLDGIGHLAWNNPSVQLAAGVVEGAADAVVGIGKLAWGVTGGSLIDSVKSLSTLATNPEQFERDQATKRKGIRTTFDAIGSSMIVKNYEAGGQLAYKAVVDHPGFRQQWDAKIAKTVADLTAHHGDVGDMVMDQVRADSLLGGIVEPYATAVDHGRGMEAFGRGVFDVGTLAIPGVDAAAVAGKIGKAAEVVGKIGKAEKLARSATSLETGRVLIDTQAVLKKVPNARHFVMQLADRDSVNAKAMNTVIDSDVNVEHDVSTILSGGAHHNVSGQWELPNGRVYAEHGTPDSSRLIPVSGPGMTKLDRYEYLALHEIAKSGSVDGARAALDAHRPPFRPEQVDKAAEVWNRQRPVGSTTEVGERTLRATGPSATLQTTDGYAFRGGFETFHDGFKIHVEDPGAVPSATTLTRVEEIAGHLDAMPAALRSNITTINHLMADNPADRYRAAKTSNNNFKSEATAGGNVINFWNGDKVRASTIWHEATHLLGRDGGPVDAQRWSEAMASDQKLQNRLLKHQTVVTNPMSITPRKLTDSQYSKLQYDAVNADGTRNLAEDWAEFGSFAMHDSLAGESLLKVRRHGVTTGYSAAELYPNRMALYRERIADHDHASHTE